MPNTTAGLIIGKGGATIRHIMESSGAKVQLSQKPEQINLQVSETSSSRRIPFIYINSNNYKITGLMRLSTRSSVDLRQSIFTEALTHIMFGNLKE